MKKIDFTDEEITFLKDLANELKTQDNRATAKPLMFGVKYNQKVLTLHQDEADYIEIYDQNNMVMLDADELEETLIARNLKYTDKFLKYYDRVSSGDKVHESFTRDESFNHMQTLKYIVDELLNDDDDRYILIYRNKVNGLNNFSPNMFLTDKDANEYIENQRHNLGPNPFTYCYYMGCDARLKKLLTIIEGVFTDV